MHTLSTEVKAVLDRFAPQCFQLHVSTYTFYFIIMHYIVINLSEGLIPIKCKKSPFKAKQVCVLVVIITKPSTIFSFPFTFCKPV